MMKYAWLYDYLYNCENKGCNINDNNSYTGQGTAGDGVTLGYWTSTTVGNAGDSYFVWIGYWNGTLSYSDADNGLHGVRPVITIPKSLVS